MAMQRVFCCDRMQEVVYASGVKPESDITCAVTKELAEALAMADMRGPSEAVVEQIKRLLGPTGRVEVEFRPQNDPYPPLLTSGGSTAWFFASISVCTG